MNNRFLSAASIIAFAAIAEPFTDYRQGWGNARAGSAEFHPRTSQKKRRLQARRSQSFPAH